MIHPSLSASINFSCQRTNEWTHFNAYFPSKPLVTNSAFQLPLSIYLAPLNDFSITLPLLPTTSFKLCPLYAVILTVLQTTYWIINLRILSPWVALHLSLGIPSQTHFSREPLVLTHPTVFYPPPFEQRGSGHCSLLLTCPSLREWMRRVVGVNTVVQCSLICPATHAVLFKLLSPCMR